MENINSNTSEKTLQNKLSRRADIELIRRRANLLDGKDKLLMLMHLDNGNSFRQISRLMGVSCQTISRRINRLTARLTGRPFVIYRQNRRKFNDRQKAFAKDYFLMGLSMRQIAAKHGKSYYQVRNTMAKILRIIESQPPLPQKGTLNHGRIHNHKKFHEPDGHNGQSRRGLPDVRPGCRKAAAKTNA